MIPIQQQPWRFLSLSLSSFRFVTRSSSRPCISRSSSTTRSSSSNDNNVLGVSTRSISYNRLPLLSSTPTIPMMTAGTFMHPWKHHHHHHQQQQQQQQQQRRSLGSNKSHNNNNNNESPVFRDDDMDLTVERTALYQLHKSLGGEMVPFAGYALPIMYKGDPETTGIMKEHLWCRSSGKASIFDVSHMGQVRIYGIDRYKFIESLCVGDIKNLGAENSCLSLLTNKQGGIIDDTVITDAGEYIYMVVNGATKVIDMDHFIAQITDFDGYVHIDSLDPSHQLIAIQGSGAAAAITPFLPKQFNLSKMKFMSSTPISFDGIPECRITRCGYTGEDGFELSIPTDKTVEITVKLLDNENVNMAGLGARDSLRLEAGLCLYGHDIDVTTTPIMASLGWTLGPPGSRRRIEQGFLGANKILTPEGKFRAVEKKRIGITGMKAPAREGTIIYDAEGFKEIGKVTSGTYSPSLKMPIAMGYVLSDFTKVGTPIQLKIRDKFQKAVVTKMPFIEPKYYRIPE